MAGAANPSMVQGQPQQLYDANMRPIAGAFSDPNVPNIAQGTGTNQGPMNTPQQMMRMAPTGGMSNPYNQASMAQQGAMARTAAGMGQTAAGGMAAYQNPYENQVVQQTLRDVGSAAQMGLNQIGAQAQQARAFGGSRQGIAEAEAMKGYTQQMADAAGRLRAQGFNTALGASQADLGRQLGAAGQLAGLGQQSFGYGQQIQDQQMRQGAVQQAAMQQLIDAGRQQYQGYANAPTQKMQLPLQALGMVPYSTSQTTSGGSQTSSMNPGLFNYLQVGAQMFGGS